MLNVGCTVQFDSSIMITENKRQILLYPNTEPNVINPKQAPPLFFALALWFFIRPPPQPPTVYTIHRLRTPQRDNYNI